MMSGERKCRSFPLNQLEINEEATNGDLLSTGVVIRFT